MKIQKVKANNHKKAFEVRAGNKTYFFPYSLLDSPPRSKDPIDSLFVDKELGNEAFTYVLKSGSEGTVHMDHVLEYNEDPKYMADLILYKLTVEAQKRIEKAAISTREICRRLETSASQLYRLLDQTNYRKSVKQLLALLYILGCEVDMTFHSIRRRRSRTA